MNSVRLLKLIGIFLIVGPIGYFIKYFINIHPGDLTQFIFLPITLVACLAVLLVGILILHLAGTFEKEDEIARQNQHDHLM